MSNPFSFLERGSGGPVIGHALSDILGAGDTLIGSGTGNVNEGLGDLRKLSGDYQAQIDAGGLTPALNAQFDAAGGTISDTATRANRAFAAKMGEDAATSGGELSPAAQAEMEKENSKSVAENEFQARNQLAFQKADVSMASTQRLQDRILSIADSIRTTGLSQTQQGLMAKLQGAGLSITRMQDIVKDILGPWGGI